MRFEERFGVVLVRPTESGNVGSVARAMANTGLLRLVIVEPAAAIDGVARAFGVGAGHVLDAAQRVGSVEEALAPFQRVVGTSSTRNRQLDVPLLDLGDLVREIGRENAAVSTALLFGPERSGLNNEELALCSLLVRIPTAPEQPTLNLSQAVLLVCHALYLESSEAQETHADGDPPAATEEIEGLFGHVRQVLEEVGFTRDDTAGGVLRDLRRLAARSGLTSREVTILRGICRRALNKL